MREIEITNCPDEIDLQDLELLRCGCCGSVLGWIGPCDNQSSFFCDRCVSAKKMLDLNDRLRAHSESITKLEK